MAKKNKYQEGGQVKKPFIKIVRDKDKIIDAYSGTDVSLNKDQEWLVNWLSNRRNLLSKEDYDKQIRNLKSIDITKNKNASFHYNKGSHTVNYPRKKSIGIIY